MDPSPLLAELVRHAPVGLVLFDRQLRFVWLNERLATMNGVSVAETIGRPLGDVLPEVADRFAPLVREVFRSGQAVEGVEIAGETPAEPGRRRLWIAGYLPIRLAGPEVVAVGGCVLEVTERREAEAALRASEARYRYLYERTPVMMHSIDRAGRLVDVSDAWLERLGYTREEVLGRPSTDFLTPASREYAAKVVLPAYFRTGACHDVEYQFVRKDGGLVDVLLSAVAERDEQGGFQRSLAVLVDVTERKKTEAALRLSEAQLRQAQKMEAIGRLAGGVAHDFNNLLVVILGYAELLLDKVQDPDLRMPVENIARAGERAAALTRQILTFSRQQVVQPKTLDLNDLIRDVEKLLGRLIREDIELVSDLQPGIGHIRADPGAVTQVLMNLAVNASDAMPNGGRLTIETSDATVETRGACDPGRYVLLAVSDTGIGMDPATQARVFDPFFTTKEPGRGTGLGLATAYGIVRQAGGCIVVYSEPGHGTTFHVYFPRVEAAAEAPPPAPRAAPPSKAPCTVLVVEDDEMVRTIVSDVLRENGYTALVAAHADGALGLVRGHEGPIDLVLTDVVMPGTTSEALADEVRSRHPEARIVYMSGYTPPNAAAIDPRSFLQKPFTMNAMLRKLQAARVGEG